MADEFEYKWTGDYAVTIDGHTTPEGAGVHAEPGEKFKTVAPIVGAPNVVAVSANAKAADKAAESAPETTEPPAESDAPAIEETP